MTAEAELGVTWPQVKECQQPPAAGESDAFSPRAVIDVTKSGTRMLILDYPRRPEVQSQVSL